jgi:hypothetical protein
MVLAAAFLASRDAPHGIIVEESILQEHNDRLPPAQKAYDPGDVSPNL